MMRLYRKPALSTGAHARVMAKLQAALPSNVQLIGMQTENCFYVETEDGEYFFASSTNFTCRIESSFLGR